MLSVAEDVVLNCSSSFINRNSSRENLRGMGYPKSALAQGYGASGGKCRRLHAFRWIQHAVQYKFSVVIHTVIHQVGLSSVHLSWTHLHPGCFNFVRSRTERTPVQISRIKPFRFLFFQSKSSTVQLQCLEICLDQKVTMVRHQSTGSGALR